MHEPPTKDDPCAKLIDKIAEIDARHAERELRTKEKVCKCTMHQSMVGDGCEVCNPALALEYAKDQIAELKQDGARYESSRAVLTLLNDTQRDKIRELETERDHYKPFPDLLKRATFLLGTLCLAHGVTSENVQRLLDDAGNALKGVRS